MSKYLTKQRKLLLDFLSDHADENLTAKKITEALASDGISISAVYRNLSALEAEGSLRRLVVSGGREIVYQYRNEHECREHLHMSCTQCGRTYHMEASHAAKLISDVSRDEGFSVCMEDTVLYGVCASCRATGRY